MIEAFQPPEGGSGDYCAFENPSSELYEYVHTEDNEILIREVFSKRIIYKGSGYRECFLGIWENKLVLSFWTEDSDGRNYESFLKIIDMKNDVTTVYKGVADYKEGNVILFS